MGSAGSCSKGSSAQTPAEPSSIRAVQLDCGALFINGRGALSSAGEDDPVAAVLDQGGAVYVPALRPATDEASAMGDYMSDGAGSDASGEPTVSESVYLP